MRATVFKVDKMDECEANMDWAQNLLKEEKPLYEVGGGLSERI